jgi:protein disulfide-isomerase A1
LAYVTEFSDKTAPKIFGGDIKKHILAFVAKSDEKFEEYLKDFTEVAKKYKGKVLFVHLDCDKSDNSRILEFFDLKEDQCPTTRMIEMGQQMQKYKAPKESLTQEDVTAFVDGVLGGTLERHIKSEEIPEDNDEPVFYVVGKHFEEIAFDSEKAVFVEFYAPWCGHCKQLAPTWDKLGEHFKDRDDIIIAKSDATLNEFSKVEVQGFPTLKFFPKGEANEIVDYSGGRDLDSLIAFVENQGKEGAEEEADDDEQEVEEETPVEEEDKKEPEAKDEL